jgi:hypothetical protein
MATKRAQTMAKRAREQALREKRERKQAKKADALALKLNPPEEVLGEDDEATEVDGSTDDNGQLAAEVEGAAQPEL